MKSPVPVFVGLDNSETSYWTALCKLFDCDVPKFLELLFSGISDCIVRSVLLIVTY